MPNWLLGWKVKTFERDAFCEAVEIDISLDNTRSPRLPMKECNVMMPKRQLLLSGQTHETGESRL